MRLEHHSEAQKPDRMSRHHRRHLTELYVAILIIYLCHPLEALEEARSNSSIVAQSLNATIQTASPKSVMKKSVTSEAIESLIEEISKLKQELVPESAKQIGPAKWAPNQPAPPPSPSSSSSSVELAAVTPKASPIKKRSNEDQPQPKPTQPQPQQQEKPVAKTTKTVCEESIAVATLGYRMLCHKVARPKLAPSSQASLTHHSAASESSLTSSSLGFLDTDEGRDWQQAVTLAVAEGIQSEELARLKGILDRIIRNGNFRSISAGPTMVLQSYRQ